MATFLTPPPFPPGFPNFYYPPPIWISKVENPPSHLDFQGFFEWHWSIQPLPQTILIGKFVLLYIHQKWPLKNFLACTPLPPGFPDPLDPRGFTACHPCVCVCGGGGGGGGVWIISGITQCCVALNSSNTSHVVYTLSRYESPLLFKQKKMCHLHIFSWIALCSKSPIEWNTSC